MLPVRLMGPRDIKYHMTGYLESRGVDLRGKTVVDIPAGRGVTSGVLNRLGAEVLPYDLFSERFEHDELSCEQADLSRRLPLEDSRADMVVCQEGIEHLSDQFFPFKEFNRVLRPGGELLVTTPNYSSIRSKLSYLLMESERYIAMMPPNEIDSIWGAAVESKNGQKEYRFYYGHIFLVGIQRLRLLGQLAGFRLKKIHPVRISPTSLVMFLPLYPLITLANLLGYLKNTSKVDDPQARQVYRELLACNLHPATLLGSHLFLEFEKTRTLQQACDEVRVRTTPQCAPS
ncbi:MAG: class I SAM-dependent methyltransferase [Deltaproteobacteria bacterium]|nr:class I SAM-dependent methyltransferase [Deltaproteobacteria bacterium]